MIPQSAGCSPDTHRSARPNYKSLSDEHRRMLEQGSAIDVDVIAESGAYTVESGSELPDVFSERQRRRAPGIMFVSHRPNGETSWCFRPDRPNPKRLGHKYEQPAKALGGAGNVLDILPSQHELIADTSVPVVFVEGSKKMMSVVSAAREAEAGETVLVVSIIGCWNFLHNGGEIIPDMLDIPLEGRKVTVMFDSDMLRKVEVGDAARRLAEYLQERGAHAYVTYFQDQPDGGKCGADDFFVGGGSFAELRLLTRPYRPEDFTLVRLSRDDTLRAMLSDLGETYAAMPVAVQGQCSDRATIRHAIAAAAKSGTVHSSELGEGIAVRLPLRRMAVQTRMGKDAQRNSLSRLQRDGYLTRIPEPQSTVDEHGAAYLLFASAGGRALRRQGRREGVSRQHNSSQQREDKQSYKDAQESEKPDTYADLYGGVYPARSPSSEVPELRAPKCLHTWGRKNGRPVVLYSEYFYRLSKTRQEIIMHLLECGGEAHEDELLARFGSKSTRLRDFRRRRLAPLMGYRFRRDKETGAEERLPTGPPIIETDEAGTVHVLPEWRHALEEHRQATDEDGDTRRQAEKYAENRRKYRERDRSEPDKQPNPLRGKRHMRPVVRERAREDKERWRQQEQGARRVRVTATEFLQGEADGEIGPLLWQARKRWKLLHSGTEAELDDAIARGPFVLRTIHGETYIDPAKSPEPEVHPLDCECLECACRAPRYAKAWSAA